MKIFLIGYRGTGKTTVGKLLASNFKLPFWDTDFMIEQEMGISIKDIITNEGWEFFRDRENRVFRKLKSLGNGIVATGGGSVLLPENVELMKEMGKVIWMITSVPDLIERINLDPRTKSSRPQFTEKNIVEETVEMLKFRIPLYKNAADFHCDTTGKSIQESVDEICAKLIKLNIHAN